MNPEELARANRAMVAERAQLLAQLTALQTANAQRAVNGVADWVIGIDQLVSQADRGDQQARDALRQLARVVKRLADFDSVLAVVRKVE